MTGASNLPLFRWPKKTDWGICEHHLGGDSCPQTACGVPTLQIRGYIPRQKRFVHEIHARYHLGLVVSQPIFIGVVELPIRSSSCTFHRSFSTNWEDGFVRTGPWKPETLGINPRNPSGVSVFPAKRAWSRGHKLVVPGILTSKEPPTWRRPVCLAKTLNQPRGDPEHRAKTKRGGQKDHTKRLLPKTKGQNAAKPNKQRAAHVQASSARQSGGAAPEQWQVSGCFAFLILIETSKWHNKKEEHALLELYWLHVTKANPNDPNEPWRWSCSHEGH